MEEVKEKEFRLQNKWLALTYATHIDKLELQDFIEGLFPNTPLVVFEAAHETGKDDPVTPYEHTHVGIEWKKAIAKRNATRTFDFKGLHPHIGLSNGKMIQNKKMFKDWLEYMAKEDPACSHLLPPKTPYEIIKSCNTIQEAMGKAKTFGEALGIEKMYAYKEPDKISYMEIWRPWGWQIELMRLLFNFHGDERTIYWYWEPTGKTGKTMLMKWLLYSNPNFFCAFQGLSYARDSVQVIKNSKSDGWNGHCVLINLPRKFETTDFVYETIETIKDSIYTSTKYNGSTFQNKWSHVVVFANWPPRMKYDINGNEECQISADRLCVIKIDPSGMDPNPPFFQEGPLPVFPADAESPEQSSGSIN